MVTTAALTPDDCNQLLRLREALAPMQGTVSLPVLIAVLTIATDPGISVNELGEKMGTPQQTASRHVAMLTGRYEVPGQVAESFEPLVAQEIHPEDPRKRALFLTDAGRKFIKSLLSASRQNGSKQQ
jgi:DNA-binding MarR family transcriptional regulator